MPYELDDLDISIIKSLEEDGRKSFRQMSRELDVSTPTIQARYNRLISIGLIKKISPVIDSSKVSSSKIKDIVEHKNLKLKIGTQIEMICDLCEGPIASKPHVLKFADIERFFCCGSCKGIYKEKYKGRIDSLTKKYENQKRGG